MTGKTDISFVIKVITPGGYILRISPESLPSDLAGLHERNPDRVAKALSTMTGCRVTAEHTTIVTHSPEGRKS